MTKHMQFTLDGSEIKKWNAADIVYTPDNIARMIVDMFKPEGRILEPAKGGGAFLQYMPDADWCEIQEGRDFFEYNKKVDWIITNPPYSIFRRFLLHSMEISDNIVMLVPLHKIFGNWGVLKELKAYGGIKAIWMVHADVCNFDFDFPLGAVYIKRNYNGGTDMSYYGDVNK